MLTFHRYQKGKKGVVWVLKKELSLRLLSGHVDSRVVMQCVCLCTKMQPHSVARV